MRRPSKWLRPNRWFDPTDRNQNRKEDDMGEKDMNDSFNWPPEPGVYQCTDPSTNMGLIDILGVAREYRFSGKTTWGEDGKGGLWVVGTDGAGEYKAIPYNDFFAVVDGKPRYVLLQEVMRARVSIDKIMNAPVVPARPIPPPTRPPNRLIRESDDEPTGGKMEKTIRKKAMWHKPTGKWMVFDFADALYGGTVDGVEEATLFEDGITVEGAMDGVSGIDPDPANFEMRDVEVTYRT